MPSTPPVPTPHSPRRPAPLARAALLLALAGGLAAPLAGRTALAGVSAPPVPVADASRQEDFRWRGVVAAGQWVEVKGVNGPIRAEPTTGREVEVVAVRRAERGGSVEEVRIQALPHARGVTVCALYPAQAGRPANRCTPGAGGQSSTSDTDVRVDFVVRVPRGVHFLGATVLGDVEARSLPADATVSSVTGDVRVSAAGVVEASSVSGSVDARTGRASPRRELRFSTVSGNLTVRVPAGFRARVRATTTTGQVSSDFPLAITRGRYVGESAEGQVGAGGHALHLSTVSGRIELRRDGGPVAGRRNGDEPVDGERDADEEADEADEADLTDPADVVDAVGPARDADDAEGVRAGSAGDFRWSGAVAAGQRVEIRGVNGGIRAEPASGRKVEVVATRRAGRSGRAGDVRIETVRHDGGVTLCAVYPTPARARQPNRCLPGDGWRVDNDGNDVRVDFVVRLPRGVHFSGRTVNGAIDAQGLTGDAAVATVNGAVTVGATGVVEAETVNGTIRATMGSAAPGRDLAFHTLNGDIVLRLPAGFGGRVRARGRGGVTSDFPLSVDRGRLTRSSAEGQIGRGGYLLRLETFNGSVHLRRSGGEPLTVRR